MTTVDAGELTEKVLLERLAAMVPALRRRADQTEQIRRVPDATMQEAFGSGYLGAFRPRRYGGPGLGLSALANGARILAHGCASSAWTLVFLAQHVWMLGKGPLALQDHLLGDGEIPLIAGALASVGTATRADGGYLVSGRSEWNSGIWNASWTSMKARVDDTVHAFYLRVDDLQLDDLWRTSGMRGTGSDSFTAHQVFVPEVLAVPLQVLMGGDRPGGHPDEPFLDYPYISGVSLTCSAVVLGAAEAAVELFEGWMRQRILAFSGEVRQADQPFAQMRLGQVVTQVRMARALWDSCIHQLDRSYGLGGSLEVADRVGIRSSCALVVQTCRDAVNTIMNASGGSSYFESMPLQRIQRDLEVLKSHAMFDWDRVAQLQGRATLGIAPGPTDLV